jgi:hypothetical protein
MARTRNWRTFAAWAATGGAGLGAGAAVLFLLEPARRERASAVLDRVGGSAREAGERLGAAGNALDLEGIARRPDVLGAVLIGRAMLGGGLLRIPFGLLGLSTLARAASTSERGRAALAAATRGVRALASALRSFSTAAAERASSSSSGPTVLGPGATPAS